MKKPASAVIFILILGVLAFFLMPRILRVHNLQVRSDRLEEELKKIQRENRLLENELRLLRDDPVYLELVARRKLNKVKEGEIVYKVEKDREVEQPGSSMGSKPEGRWFKSNPRYQMQDKKATAVNAAAAFLF